jgi:branched-chain amino acid transport system permease protein
MSVRASVQRGLLTGVVNVFAVLLGLTGLVGTLVKGWLRLASPLPGAWLLLLAVALWGGAAALRRAGCKSWKETLAAGLLAGGSHGLLLALFTWGVSSLLAGGADVRKWLVQLTPEAIRLLTFGRAPAVAAVVMCAALTAAGLAGAAWAFASARYGWRESLRERWGAARARLLALPPVQSARQHKHSRAILYGAGLLILFVAPLFLGQYWNYALGTVGIYVMLGLGLNIVVGMAGLLDLGYVAFFAIGAYSVALLTAPEPHGAIMGFWPALVIGVVLAAVSGVLLGVPVLRMRGDYLAIVTLGFGEIIRILAKSDVLTGFTGGPGGVRAIAGPSLFGFNLNDEFYFLYFIIFGIMLLAFITVRLQYSRVGRAWMAMREDEDVAQAVGVYTLKYKLLAFAIGAAFAGFGGVIFASRNKFAGPEDFTLLVSINVLCLVIIGGMGSIPGVIVGALVLKGLPEVLRQLQDYRMLAFGMLLIVMMILRPEGLWPSKRKQMELRGAAESAPPGPREGAGA